MRIERIAGFQPYVAPVTDFSDAEPVSPTKKVIDNKYYKDTIDLHASEHYLNLAFINAMTAQRQNHENSSILSLETLKETMSANNDLRTELYDQQQELINKVKKSDVLKVVDTVTMAGLIVGGVITVGLTAFLGFAVVPAALVALNCFFALANGGTKIANGVTKYQADQLKAQIFEIGEQRKLNQTKSTDHMDQQNSSKEKVFDTFKIMSDNENKKQETVRAIVARS